ncbi:hypothetical protein [Kutzneria buriramensis]|uniref:hypothetical protein n=1 Tax=Kutzneria buriramensis TaxID=1045776 RepID=UPI0011C1BB2B|nr:hypothetical protein [Kutzneria buriramensis]
MIAVLAAVCAYFVGPGRVEDSALTLFGGVPGHATVNECSGVKGGRRCTSTFVSDPGAPSVRISGVLIEPASGLQPGTTVAGRVAGAESTQMYADGSLVQLIPLTIFGGTLLGLIVLLVRFPLRAAIHLWRPDIWPYSVWPPRVPRAGRIGATAAKVSATLLAAGFALGIASGVGVWWAIGLLVVMLAIAATVIVRKARHRAAASP